MTLADTLRASMDRRAALVAELAALDAEMREARKLLGLPVSAPAPAPKPRPPTDVETPCEICGQPYPKQPNNPGQRICAPCRDRSPHLSVEAILGTATPDSVCERCGQPFLRGNGHSGRFCSRSCYAGMPMEERRAAILAVLATGPSTPGLMVKLPQFIRTNRTSLQNDLHGLRAQGLVESTEHGWRLRVGPPEPAPPKIDPYTAARQRVMARATALGHDLKATVHDGEQWVTLCSQCAITVSVITQADGRIVESPPVRSCREERQGHARKAEPPPLRAKEHRELVLSTLLPDRRCGRCCHKFRPTHEREFVCPNCVDAPKVKPADPDPELEPVWDGGEGLSGQADGFGSTLSGGSFKAHV